MKTQVTFDDVLSSIAREMNLVSSTCTYANICYFMQREDLTAILKELIRISSTPLKDVESNFAIDSSGFSTSRFGRWFDYKWGKERKYRMWLKAHINTGVKTNIITSVDVTAEYVHESPAFKRLVKETAENFKIEEISGDKAYSGRNNLKAVEEVGGLPFIAFKDNATERPIGATIWKKMYHYYQYRREEYLQHYHLRSNIETTNHIIKSKFGDYLRSKTAQINELLLKILCHNICVIIEAMFELNIKPEFNNHINNKEIE